MHRNIINDICLDSNDKVIKELASELEQSTAKKDFNSNKKDDKYKINKNIIEPLNLIKTIQEEKELPDSSSSLRDKVDTMLLNSNHSLSKQFLESYYLAFPLVLMQNFLQVQTQITR